MTTEFPARSVCLASFFLQLDAANCRWWKQLQTELARYGMDLVLLGTTPPADPELRVIVVPFWLHGYADAYATPATPVILEDQLTNALITRDNAWTLPERRNPIKSTVGLGVCQQIMREVLDGLQPAAVLVWGNSLPQSFVLQQLAVQHGRPCWVIERGLLPGTLMMEMAGQGGQSELNLSFTLSRALQTSCDSDLFLSAQSDYRSRRESKYSQAEFLDTEAFRKQHNPSGRKLVALLLQHDVSSCLVPCEYRGAQLHSPVFASSEEAMLHLATVARELDCTVLAKPHPVDQTDYTHCQNDYLRVVRDVNLMSMVEAADVVAAMTSTAQFEALLSEKPLLLLAHSPLANKGVAYEVKELASLVSALRAALDRDNFESRLVRAREVLTFILKYYSIALTDNSSAKATLGDLAGFLAQNALPPAGESSTEMRLNVVERCLDHWKLIANPANQTPPSQRATPPTASAPPCTDHSGESTESLQQRAAQLCTASNWKGAAELYQSLVNRQPNDVAIWWGRIECARQQGYSVMAALLLEEALETHPEWAVQLRDRTKTATATLLSAGVAT